MIPMNSVALYQKKLKKQLPCNNAVKKRLLENFQTSLDEFLEDHPSPTVDELNTAFGPPEEIAKILSKEISPEEADSYHKSCTIKKVLSAISAGILLLFMLYVFFWKSKPITYKTETNIISEITSPSEPTGGT